MRIARENTKLIKRIYERRSEYSKKNFDKDYKTSRNIISLK